MRKSGRGLAEPLDELALAVRRLVLVDDALRARLVESLDSETQGLDGAVCTLGGAVCTLGGIGRGVLDASAKLGLDGLVPQAKTLVLTVSFDLALDVCHGVEECNSSFGPAEPFWARSGGGRWAG